MNQAEGPVSPVMPFLFDPDDTALDAAIE